MKALIFNSGIGKRMGTLTKNTHKSLVVLNNGETVLERQIRILSECGINEFVITTGPFENDLKIVANKYSNLKFHFVHNALYEKTNYIYSFYLTKDFLDDDFVILHGDLVFNKNLVKAILQNECTSVGLINKSIPKPDKDFKARIIDGKVKEVGINLFDENCYAFQPLYKLCKVNVLAWWQRISDFIKLNICNVYAENALNEITEKVQLNAMSYDGYFIDEIDNKDDYVRVASQIRLFDFNEQENEYSLEFLNKLTKPLVVVDKFLRDKYVSFKTFSDFQANPLYEDVLKGLKEFEGCDSIVSIGGGSAIDVAKAIKYYACLDSHGKFEFKNIKHYAVPTTAGTGSESTRYAVIYKDGIKWSLTHDAIYPDVAVFIPDYIFTLPLYQKKCTLLDALCHAIESIWSVNATSESINYAQSAIDIIKENYKKFIEGDKEVISKIQNAANLAGKAINISETTAAHALSYKITSLYGIPHGHAVALSLPYLWQFLIKRKCPNLLNVNITFDEFNSILDFMDLNKKIEINEKELNVLVASINLERLKNFPIKLSFENIKSIYSQISI